MKISIITWDASFRESYHTIGSFCSQEFPIDRYEFLWVEFYANNCAEISDEVSKYKCARILNLHNNSASKWHLGKCINAGIKESTGEILVIPDGDIIVPPYLLNLIELEHSKYDNLVLYFRRWDEPENKSCDLSHDLGHLEKSCVLTNPTNYGGLLSVKRSTLSLIGNYEESDIFCGPGANGLETYIRLRNCGCAIKWDQTKIYHPYHKNTGRSDANREYLSSLVKDYPWINPYAGLEQSWIIKHREMSLAINADKQDVDKILMQMPMISPSEIDITNVNGFAKLISRLKFK